RQQETIEAGEVTVRDQAGEDHPGDPQAAIEMGEHQHEGTEVTKPRLAKQGPERFEQNLPFGRRARCHLQRPPARVLWDTPSPNTCYGTAKLQDDNEVIVIRSHQIWSYL